MQQLLTEEARIRRKYNLLLTSLSVVGTIAQVKPGKAEQIENLIIQNAQRGVFQGKVSDAQLTDLIEQVSALNEDAL